jgi:hypothetical protein
MTEQPINWSDAAADTYTHLTSVKRVYPQKAMLSVVDDLATSASVSRADLVGRHEPSDLITTTLAHVTTAIHGPGTIPKSGGWYAVTQTPTTYHVDPGFAAAWKHKRNLK